MGPLVATMPSFVCLLFVGCLTSQQHASVFQGRICSDNVTCCHTEIEVADQTFYLTQSQYTDTGPTSPALTLKHQAPGRVANGVPFFKSPVWLGPEKITSPAGFEPGIFRSLDGRLNHEANEAVHARRWRYTAGARSGRPSVSMLWPGGMASLIC